MLKPAIGNITVSEARGKRKSGKVTITTIQVGTSVGDTVALERIKTPRELFKFRVQEARKDNILGEQIIAILEYIISEEYRDDKAKMLEILEDHNNDVTISKMILARYIPKWSDDDGNTNEETPNEKAIRTTNDKIPSRIALTDKVKYIQEAIGFLQSDLSRQI